MAKKINYKPRYDKETITFVSGVNAIELTPKKFLFNGDGIDDTRGAYAAMCKLLGLDK